MGMKRDTVSLKAALDALDLIDATGATGRARNRVSFAKAIVASALSREESRGAHFRADYPQTREDMRVTTVCSFDGRGPKIEQRSIPNRRLGGDAS